MAQLLNRFKIHNKLFEIIEDAEEQLIIISPHIKLDDDYRRALFYRIDDHRLRITIIFRKDEEAETNHLSQEDFDFLKQFPNIEIKQCIKLNAKIYANERQALVTSMNLRCKAQEPDIEAGILSKFNSISSFANLKGLLTGFTKDSLDQQIYDLTVQIIKKDSEIIFKTEPVYDKSFLTQTYLRSEIKINCSDD